MLGVMNNLLAISGNVRWVARYGSSRSSAPVRLIAPAPAEAEPRAAAAATAPRPAAAQRPRPLDQRAQARTELEHALGLGENRAGGARVTQREMRARELETDRAGHARKTRIELRPQPVGARQRRSRLPVSGLVEGDPCRRNMDDCGGRVVTETLRVDDRLGRPCAFGALPP